MKKVIIGGLLLFAIILAVTSIASAGPFLVCDPYPTTVDQPTEFRITYGTTTIVSQAETMQDGSKRLHWDLAPLSPGTYNISISAAKIDPIWGDLVSTAVPFTFTKPAPGTLPNPANIKLQK